MTAAAQNLIANRISSYRAAKDVPMAALAGRLGVAESQLRQLEQGRRLPTLPTLRKIAEFFELSASEIGRYVLAASGTACGPRPRARRNA